MSLDAAELARVLGETRGVDEFVACERRRVRARRDLGVRGGAMRVEERELRADLYSDLTSGRGEARESFSGLSISSARDRAREAASRAAAVAGPAWRLPAPAAPARVQVADPSFVKAPERAVEIVVAALATALPSGARLVRGTLVADAERIEIHSSSGLASAFESTRIAWRAAIGFGERPPVIVEGEARRLDDLDLAGELAAAAERSAASEPLAPGRYDLVVTLRALVPSQPTFAWLAPIAAQADGGRLRRGLSRYRPPQGVFGDDAIGDHLTVTSDGTLPFASLSAPLGDRGEPVRRFPLVERGRAAGVGLDLREAGLRDTAANGGVRNLVVAAGTDPAAILREPGERPLLVTGDLAWMKADPGGLIVAALGSSVLAGGGARRGGLIAEDALNLWARARLAAEIGQRGWYRGPIAVRFDDVTIS